jgi:hypothetical protein
MWSLLNKIGFRLPGPESDCRLLYQSPRRGGKAGKRASKFRAQEWSGNRSRLILSMFEQNSPADKRFTSVNDDDVYV